MKVIGIDPGLKGGISGIDTDAHTLWAIAMPLVTNPKTDKNEYDITAIAKILSIIQPDQVCLERVHSMPGQGVASTFLFGTGYGILLGVTGTLGLSLTLVLPRVWKAKYQISSDKELSRTKASELFPECQNFWKLKKHDGLAEAALLANYLLGSDHLDEIRPRDISDIYKPEVIPNDRSKSGTRRHNSRSKNPKNHRARDGTRQRRDHSTG